MPGKSTLPALILALVIPASMAMAEEPASRGAAVLSKKQAATLELTASTPEDHLKLAAYYQAQARRFDQKVRYHQEMAEWYRERPLPYDGKMPIPMQRHCKEWASRFAEQAERVAVLAKLHEQRALGVTTSASAFEHPSQWGLRSIGFGAPNPAEKMIQVTATQGSLFLESVTAAMRFYERSKILSYFVSAKGQALIETVELRRSATALFDSHERFLQSLTEAQRAALGPRTRELKKLQRAIERALKELDRDAASPAGVPYFQAAKKIKHSLEKWHAEQRQIGVDLGIPMESPKFVVAATK